MIHFPMHPSNYDTMVNGNDTWTYYNGVWSKTTDLSTIYDKYLKDLEGVNVSSPSNNDALIFDGTNWNNGAYSESNPTAWTNTSTYFWKANHSSAYNLTFNTWNKLRYDTLTSERHGGSSNYNSSSYRYTVPVSGFWFINYCFTTQTYSDKYVDCAIYINGSRKIRQRISSESDGGGSGVDYIKLNVYACPYLNQGDYIEAWTFCGGYVLASVFEGNRFFGCYLGS